MQMISEETIKNILRNHDIQMNAIRHKMTELSREKERTDALLNALSVNADEKFYGKQYGRYLERHNKEIQTIFDKLVKEEEIIQRVWTCFYALDEPYYSILYALYVEQQLYKTVEAEYRWSHRIFERDRKKGIMLIQQTYYDLYNEDKEKIISSG